jgi:outer membrane receptor protein involved in Fe transport
MRLVYDRGPLQTSLNWQYLGSVDEGNPSTPRARLKPHGSISYFDLYGRYSIRESIEIAVGVTNLLDEQPPIILTGFTATNTDNTTYDGIGRRYFVSTRVRF